MASSALVSFQRSHLTSCLTLLKSWDSAFRAWICGPREAKTKKLITDLLEARLDAAIVALPISEPSLEELTLLDEEFVLLRPERDINKPVPQSGHAPDHASVIIGRRALFQRSGDFLLQQ